MEVKLKKLKQGARLPEKATAGSAAYDLYVPEDTVVKPGRCIVPLNFALEIPEGYEALIDARSGFSAKGMEGYECGHATDPDDGSDVRVTKLDSERFDCDVIEGKIDSDYRGNVGVIVHNRDRKTFMLKAGTRIAQMTFHKVETVSWKEVEELTETERDGGFGSTGTK